MKETRTHQILKLLSKDLTGKDIVDRSNIPQGSVYVILKRMFDNGLIDRSEVGRKRPAIGIPLVVYSLTEKGRKYRQGLIAFEKEQS